MWKKKKWKKDTGDISLPHQLGYWEYTLDTAVWSHWAPYRIFYVKVLVSRISSVYDSDNDLVVVSCQCCMLQWCVQGVQAKIWKTALQHLPVFWPEDTHPVSCTLGKVKGKTDPVCCILHHCPLKDTQNQYVCILTALVNSSSGLRVER